MNVERSAPRGAVFLSYARDDASSARRIAEALRASGLEVWFDENELRGGDAWDAKIRQQIDACTLFLAVISQHTQARAKGYFRLEWKLAVEQMHMLLDGVPFVVPVVIDDTPESAAAVPAEFMRVQWTRLPGALPTPQFVEQMKRLLDAPRSTPGSGTRERFAESPDRNETLTRSATKKRTPLIAGAVIAAAMAALATWQWQARHGDIEQPRHDATATAKVTAAQPPLDFASLSVARSAKPEGLAKADAKSIAVLAFADLSAEKDGEYFSDGISEELLNVLAKVPGLSVAARTSAFFFKGKQVPIPEIAKQLNVAYVVEGSVRKSGSRARITAQLIKASDGFHVWSDNFDRDLKDIFAVQDEIAGLIAQNLQLKLGAAPRVAKTVNPEAHRLALEGWHFWYLRTEEAFAKSEAAFANSLAIDPNFAPAHAGLADVQLMRAVYRTIDGHANTLSESQQIRAAAERALQLDSSLAEPHGVLAHLLYEEGRFAAAHEQYRLAFARNPNYAGGHLRRAVLLEREGRIDASMRENEEVIRLDPLWATAVAAYSRQLARVGRLDEALKFSDRAAVLRTDVFLPSRGYRTEFLWALGRRAEAVELARSIRQTPPALRPRWDADAIAIWVLHQAGLTEAADYANEFLPRLPPDSHMRGFVLAALGRFEQALPFLERTPLDNVNHLYTDAMFDPWREDPRFPQLMLKLGRAAEYKVARETLARMQKEQATQK